MFQEKGREAVRNDSQAKSQMRRKSYSEKVVNIKIYEDSQTHSVYYFTVFGIFETSWRSPQLSVVEVFKIHVRVFKLSNCLIILMNVALGN